MRKSIGIAIVAMSLAHTARAQAKAPEWEFVGIEVHEKVGCVNDPVTSYTWQWLRRGPDYEASRNALKASIQEKYNGMAMTSTWTYRGQPLAIGVYKKTLKCTQWGSKPDKVVESFQFFFGSSREDVEKRALAYQAEYKSIISIEAVKWIDVEGDTRPPG